MDAGRAFELLGLPRSASLEQIAVAYEQHVRDTTARAETWSRERREAALAQLNLAQYEAREHHAKRERNGGIEPVEPFRTEQIWYSLKLPLRLRSKPHKRRKGRLVRLFAHLRSAHRKQRSET
jgi:hypothetical protein